MALASRCLPRAWRVSTYIGANSAPVGAEELLSSFEAHVQATGIATIVAGEEEERQERERAQAIQDERDERTRGARSATRRAEARDLRHLPAR